MPSYVVVLTEEERDGAVNGTYHAGLDDLSAAIIRNALTEDEAQERMAQHLAFADEWCDPPDWDELPADDTGKAHYRMLARAALAALHPLTDERN